MTQAVISPPRVIDPRQLRDVLGTFPTGVAVVTAETVEGQRIGITITSFNSVSLDPPLILFSIDLRCLSLPALMGVSQYTVNILGEAQQEVSTRFATARSDKWAGVSIEQEAGLPFTLRDAMSTFQCEAYAQHEGGDHVIFVGRVLRAEQKCDVPPLVFHKGTYRLLAQED